MNMGIQGMTKMERYNNCKIFLEITTYLAAKIENEKTRQN
jgi:hypothetical protein